MDEVAVLARRLSVSTSETDTFRQVQQACVRLATDVTDVSLALVGADDSLHYFRLNSAPGEPHRHLGTRPQHTTAAGAALASGRTLCSDDPSDAKLEDWQTLADTCQSAICVPMYSNKVAIGCLNVSSSRRHVFSRLRSTFSALAAVIAPHLRLARTEKTLQATQLLLRDALAAEQAYASAVLQQQQQQRRRLPRQHLQHTAAAGDSAVAAPATPRTTHGAAPRAQSTAPTVADVLDARLSVAPPAAASAPTMAAQTLAAQPLVERIAAAAGTAAGWLRSLTASGTRAAAPEATTLQAAEAAQPEGSQGKAGKGRLARQRHRGEGYAFEDYELSSDDETAEPSCAAAVPAAAASLGRWRGALEFRDAAAEGAYLDWACSTWQAPLDIAVGSAVLGHIMMLVASPNTDCIGCGLLEGGPLLAVCRVLLAVLLLYGVHLMLLRRSRCARHREWLVSWARVLCLVMASARLASPDQAQWGLVARLRALPALPSLAILLLAAQVRFSRHMLLTAAQAAAATAAVGYSWQSAVSRPAELGRAIGSVLLPTAGLYLMEAAARRKFIRSHMPLHVE